MYYFHHIYGYDIRSVINLYFLRPCTPNKYSHYIEINEIFECKHNNRLSEDQINLNEIFLYRKNLCNFYITNNGTKLFFLRHNKTITNKDIAKSIINSALGYCLYQMNHNVLHASAIEHNDKAVLFLGSSGSGKSSIAASFNKKLITEDVACIENINNKFFIRNGTPFVKLNDKVANLFKLKKFAEISNDRLGRDLYFINKSSKKTIEIKSIYFLSWGAKFNIKELNTMETIACFLTNTYSAFPYNSCIESSKISMSFIEKITMSHKIFLIERNKDFLFNSNKDILDHIELN